MRRYIILAFMFAVLTACNHNAGGEESIEASPKLTLYIYSPEHPAVTRVNTGYVASEYDERKVTSMQIWVFKTNSSELVGYLSLGDSDCAALNNNGNIVLQMVIGRAFSNSPENVDVYAIANFTPSNTGLEFNAATSKSILEDAIMGATATSEGNADPYGLTNLVKQVPTEGLPMSGVLRNQPITGEAPVLRIGTRDRLASVKLVRMVSKMNFVFSRGADSEQTLEIKDISLYGNMIPAYEYLFLQNGYDERSSHVGESYVLDSHPLLDEPLTDSEIGKPEDPSVYFYTAQNAQDYENLIANGIRTGDLTQVGPFYLRESDKKLGGLISYTLDGGPVKFAPFSVAEEGDFSRNHTWIVYAHYGTAALEVVEVEVMDWKQRNSDPHSLYNW